MESISTLMLNIPTFPTSSSHLVSQPMCLSDPDAMLPSNRKRASDSVIVASVRGR